MRESSWGAPSAGSVLIAHPSAELYGSDRVMLESVSGLVDAGWKVYVAIPFDGPLVGEIRSRGAEPVVIDTPVLRKSALRPLGMLRLIRDTVAGSVRANRLLTALSPDVVYVSTMTAPLWLLSARLRGIPAMCHVHEAERAAPLMLRLGLAVPLLLARKVVTNSRFSTDVLTKTLPALSSRSSIVYNGVPGPAMVTTPRAELNGTVRIAYVGRLSARKGVDVAVEAVAKLVTSGVDAELDIVGSVFPGYEWFEEKLRARVGELGLSDRIHFRGFRPSVWDSFAAADIAVVPSTVDEPFGNTAIEAVLSARPVVVSASGGLTEAISGYDSAKAVAPGNPDSLAAALQSVIGDWDRLSKRALVDSGRAARRFSVDGYRESIVDEVHELAARSNVEANRFASARRAPVKL